MSVDYQIKFDDETTRKAVKQMVELSEVSRLPYPLLFIPEETKAEIAGIWAELGSWCEIAMTWFVTGETELTDENWNAFCQEADTRGASALTAA